jgi:hypothetical protein
MFLEGRAKIPAAIEPGFHLDLNGWSGNNNWLLHVTWKYFLVLPNRSYCRWQQTDWEQFHIRFRTITNYFEFKTHIFHMFPLENYLKIGCVLNLRASYIRSNTVYWNKYVGKQKIWAWTNLFFWCSYLQVFSGRENSVITSLIVVTWTWEPKTLSTFKSYM